VRDGRRRVHGLEQLQPQVSASLPARRLDFVPDPSTRLARTTSLPSPGLLLCHDKNLNLQLSCSNSHAIFDINGTKTRDRKKAVHLSSLEGDESSSLCAERTLYLLMLWLPGAVLIPQSKSMGEIFAELQVCPCFSSSLYSWMRAICAT
jgi:hypothetical protein